jgi:hypothetical protein
LKLLHGYVHNDTESVLLLRKNKYWVIPIINVDGSTVILEEFKKTGKLIYKRKNNNRKVELIQGNAQCELWQ